MTYLEIIVLCFSTALTGNLDVEQQQICNYVTCRVNATDKIIKNELNPISSVEGLEEWYIKNDNLIHGFCGDQPAIPSKWRMQL
jgi:hypothetical protein